MATRASSSQADERSELETLRQTTLNLIQILVQQGVLTQEKSDQLSAQIDALHQVSPGSSAFDINVRAQSSCGASEPIQPCCPRPAPAAGRSVRKALAKTSITSGVKMRGEMLRIGQ